MKTITVGNLKIANNLPLVIIAGPCQMESRQHALEMATALKEMTDKLGIGLIYKTSYDKANRTSIKAARGIGLDKSLEVFQEIRSTLGCPVTTDVHSPEHCAIVAEVVDVLQIPAFLCRQTDLLEAAAKTGKAVNIKKGQFLAITVWWWICAVSPLWPRRAIRWYLMRPIPFKNPEAKGNPPAVNGNLRPY